MKIFFLLLHLFSLAAVADVSPYIKQTAEVLNDLRGSHAKIEIPDESSNYVNVALLDLTSGNKETDLDMLEKVWGLTANPKMKCSGYVRKSLLPKLTGPIDISKRMEADILKSKSWAKALGAARLWNTMAFCDQSFIEALTYQSMLKDVLKVMLKLESTTRTSSQTAEWTDLRRSILENTRTFSPSALLKNEIFVMSALALEEQGKSDIASFVEDHGLSNTPIFEFIKTLAGDPPLHIRFKKGFAPFRALYDVADNPEASSQTIKQASMDQQSRYIAQIIKGLSLGELGINNIKDFQKADKLRAATRILKTNKKILEEKQSSFARMNPYEVLVAVVYLPEIYKDDTDSAAEKRVMKNIDIIRKMLQKL